MHSTIKIWSDFLELSWWQKIIAFIPLVVLIIFTLLLARWINTPSETINEKLLDENKRLTDKKVDDWNKSKKELEAKDKELEKKRKKIQEKIKEVRSSNEKVIEKINRANDITELCDIADELRQKQRTRTEGRTRPGYRIGTRDLTVSRTGDKHRPGATQRKDHTDKW